MEYIFGVIFKCPDLAAKLINNEIGTPRILLRKSDGQLNDLLRDEVLTARELGVIKVFREWCYWYIRTEGVPDDITQIPFTQDEWVDGLTADSLQEFVDNPVIRQKLDVPLPEGKGAEETKDEEGIPEGNESDPTTQDNIPQSVPSNQSVFTPIRVPPRLSWSTLNPNVTTTRSTDDPIIDLDSVGPESDAESDLEAEESDPDDDPSDSSSDATTDSDSSAESRRRRKKRRERRKRRKAQQATPAVLAQPTPPAPIVSRSSPRRPLVKISLNDFPEFDGKHHNWVHFKRQVVSTMRLLRLDHLLTVKGKKAVKLHLKKRKQDADYDDFCKQFYSILSKKLSKGAATSMIDYYTDEEDGPLSWMDLREHYDFQGDKDSRMVSLMDELTDLVLHHNSHGGFNHYKNRFESKVNEMVASESDPKIRAIMMPDTLKKVVFLRGITDPDYQAVKDNVDGFNYRQTVSKLFKKALDLNKADGRPTSHQQNANTRRPPQL